MGIIHKTGFNNCSDSLCNIPRSISWSLRIRYAVKGNKNKVLMLIFTVNHLCSDHKTNIQ